MPKNNVNVLLIKPNILIEIKICMSRPTYYLVSFSVKFFKLHHHFRCRILVYIQTYCKIMCSLNYSGKLLHYPSKIGSNIDCLTVFALLYYNTRLDAIGFSEELIDRTMIKQVTSSPVDVLHTSMVAHDTGLVLTLKMK